MKLKKIKKPYHPRLLNLQILKACRRKKSFDLITHTKSTEMMLNKIANLIFTFHFNNCKILFLGFPNDFSKIFKNTNHMQIPSFVWFNGMLTNNNLFKNKNGKKAKTPKNIYKLILKLKKKPDLIVIYNLNNSSAIKESYSLRIPFINISNDFSILNTKITYNSDGNYSFVDEKTKNNNFIFSLIKAIVNVKKIRRKVFRSFSKNLY